MFYVIHLLLASLLLSLLVKDNDKAIGRRASSYNLHLHFTLSRCVCISFVLFYVLLSEVRYSKNKNFLSSL